MESSEDDASTATNASRRASAREKDVGLAEDVGATGSFQQEPSDARQSCRTPAMSEDNFDGDSVPSPSAQDVNTSTEAILDMIDEIVDGPGAPKRLPLPSEAVDAPHEQLASSHESSTIIQESSRSDGDSNFLQPKVPSPAIAERKSSQPEIVPDGAQSLTCDDRPIPNVNTVSVDLSKESASIPASGEPNMSVESLLSETVSVKPELPADSPLNIPSSSEEQTVQRIMDSSKCEAQERTVKCVASSVNSDNVTVESAESTSSDSVSEGRPVIVESQTRSPLRRRLVRPIVCDRRPDSTVSSTVDSQTVNVYTTEPSSDSIAKDVSSSSDAVPIICGNVKPEEISNISEISICKAETSVSPPKKIKLIRQRTVSGTSTTRETPHNQNIGPTEKEQCQSTSSDNQLIHLLETTQSSTDLSESIKKPTSVNDCEIQEVSIQNAETVSSDKHSDQPPNREIDIRQGDNLQVLPIDLSSSISNLPSSSGSDTAIGHASNKVGTSYALNLSSMRSDTIKINNLEQGKKCDEEHSDKIDLGQLKNKILPLNIDMATSTLLPSSSCDADNNEILKDDQKKVPPIKLNLSMTSLSDTKIEAGESKQHSSISKSNVNQEETKQVPKLTIKLKQSDEMKSPIPKVTIKPIRPPEQDSKDIAENIQPVPSVTKLNIKPIPKPLEVNDKSLRGQPGMGGVDKLEANDNLPCISKLNIKPILKPPEKINDVHRKSSSSEISESEYSENDESTSTSDQTSASEHGPSDVVPKVTIKLGKPGTHSEGQFYTEKNIPRLTIKGIQQDEKEEHEPKLKLVISQSDDKQSEKVPKLTIKTVTKTENQPLSPKLTIKPLKPPDSSKESEITKVKISTESLSSSTEVRENTHVPKITIKPVTRSEAETVSRTPKKNTVCNSPDHIPVVTKLNIKPVLKPTDSGETSKSSDDKVPVVSKLNIKPVIKPKDNDVDSSVDDVPKIMKLNIKPIKNPEESSSDKKDCDEKADIDVNSIPVVSKLNIKPIVKPHQEDSGRDGENQSSETGNSSDDNTDHIPVVTKLNIKPIIKPENIEETSKSVSISETIIPVITKLNIKPLIKPGESISPSSPKKEHLRSPDRHNTSPIPIVTKLNIKPILKPEGIEIHKSKDDTDEQYVKNPPLVMKINMKSVIESSRSEKVVTNEHSLCNNIIEESTGVQPTKSANELETTKSELINLDKVEKVCSESEQVLRQINSSSAKQHKINCLPDSELESIDYDRKNVVTSPSVPKLKTEDSLKIDNIQDLEKHMKCDSLLMINPLYDGMAGTGSKSNEENKGTTSAEIILVNTKSTDAVVESNMIQPNKQRFSSVHNCTLLKKLLENTKETLDRGLEGSKEIKVNCASPSSEHSTPGFKSVINSELLDSDRINSENIDNIEEGKIGSPKNINDSGHSSESNNLNLQDMSENVNLTKPLEITISDKLSNQGSGQDSPRIILKINKTDHGPSAKIITEDIKRPDTLQEDFENTQDIVNDKSPKTQVINSRRKQVSDTSLSLSAGKRLRSSRIVENTEKPPIVRRNVGKRPSISETSPPQSKETDISVLQTKRLKLGQLLSGNKSIPVTPVTIPSQTSPTKTGHDMKQGVKTVNHSLLNNENCSKNGNSKLHNILSNLQAKKMQSLSLNNANCMDKIQGVSSTVELNSQQCTGSSGSVEHIAVGNTHPELQEMLINENTDFRDSITPEDSSRDPLEVVNIKTVDVPNEDVIIPKVVEMTPQPKKRGRPRKLPVSEGAKPSTVTLPVPALEERPQRSLRLMRDRPTILLKPRGRGRGRGRPPGSTALAMAQPVVMIEPATDQTEDKSTPGEIDPTSSRIKLPRMTEALDKMPSVCTTPLSSRRRDSSGTFPGDTPELKVVLENTLSKLDDSFTKSPEASGSGRGRGGRGRGGRGRTPRARGRGRGGGRGAMYMKETMGIYGRVCGPATTTVQLFEEETCMMDDNATPAKPSHLLDEDSQSSVKSSTNESSKTKKSKFADLFDSNKVWTAADVKEYTWPSPEGENKIMMIQEQVAMFLGVKSFKRRYAELKRRTIVGEEREYLLSKGIVTEALCDLGITAVDASEVLDIMLSDYPHKYEEYRSHQRERQLHETEEIVEEVKSEDKVMRVEMKVERIVEHKPDVPKIDPEKTRQDMAAAAIASAAEWNARANAARRGACADLQSLTVQRPRARPVAPPRATVRPPAGFYPHALLPGQYQHCYRLYTPEQLRYFPLNTVMAVPPAPASVADSSSESEGEWPERYSSSDDSEVPTHQAAKRKKITKVKRSSQAEAGSSKDGSKESGKEGREDAADGEVETCRVCKLRLEANRKYTHERFLVCSHCNAKLHPSCVELSADTIRKCREYAWQCAECKTCCSCRQPADDDKMLFCDLCDRGFHIYCVGLDTVPTGRWHCVECAICKSCGAREPGGAGASAGAGAGAGAAGAGAGGAGDAPQWHHQTRRGPGGHKVYSHSLCTPCARAYRIGRYCPLCERSFIGPKGTMQLVICKLCDRQLHQECVKQTVSSLSVLDYTCAECRRGGITSRAAAVRLAPRTIATLFMAKRRFNKYAHRQYLAARQRRLHAATPGDRADDASETSDADATNDANDVSDPLDAAHDV